MKPITSGRKTINRKTYLFFPFCFALCLITLSCRGQPKDPDTLYVAKVAWHTNLVIRSNAIPDTLWPSDFNPKMDQWLEIGWGDRNYYMSEEFKPGYLLKAVLLPTRSAFLINPVSPPLQRHFVADKVIRLVIPHSRMKALTTYILNGFATNNQNRFIAVKQGPYPNSAYIKGKERYYFPKTCNVWTAGGLKAAGCSLCPVFYQTPGKVIKKAAEYGTMIMKR